MMSVCRFVVVCAVSALTLGSAFAQNAPAAAAKPYAPSPGQEGKDVIWLPTAQGLVDRMLDMAQVTKDDYLIDLGSGDGRTVITAAKRGQNPSLRRCIVSLAIVNRQRRKARRRQQSYLQFTPVPVPLHL